MSDSFTLYRGTSGQTFLIDHRCPHRGAQLSAGWVEGDELRCFYHGWKFAGDGRCVEQPAEDNATCDRVRNTKLSNTGILRTRLCIPRVKASRLRCHVTRILSAFDGFIEVNAYFRECNFFQNLENSLDMSHVGFVHGDNSAAFSGIGHGSASPRTSQILELPTPIRGRDGQFRRFGMPNIFYMTALPTDADIGWQESLFSVCADRRRASYSILADARPGDRRNCTAYSRAPSKTHGARSIWLTRRFARKSSSGRLALSDVDPNRVDLVQLQDHRQVGSGANSRPKRERLARGDVGVVAIRRLWSREVRQRCLRGAR